MCSMDVCNHVFLGCLKLVPNLQSIPKTSARGRCQINSHQALLKTAMAAPAQEKRPELFKGPQGLSFTYSSSLSARHVL